MEKEDIDFLYIWELKKIKKLKETIPSSQSILL